MQGHSLVDLTGMGVSSLAAERNAARRRLLVRERYNAIITQQLDLDCQYRPAIKLLSAIYFLQHCKIRSLPSYVAKRL